MEATTTKLVGYTVKNGVATIELTNAPMNCYTFEMMSQIDEAVLKARFDENVHVIISRPPPTVWPFIAAITSFGVCSRRLSVSLACRQK